VVTPTSSKIVNFNAMHSTPEKINTIKLVLSNTTCVSFIIMLKSILQEQHVSTQLRSHHPASTVMKLKMAVHKQLVYLQDPVQFTQDIIYIYFLSAIVGCV
jgi:hypothetical protein